MTGHQHTGDYMAHGFCFSWEPGLVRLHVVSDIVTGLAYFSIAVALFYFMARRRDLPFYRVFLLFGVFILACGTTHFFAAYTIFDPLYWPEGWVKAFTAVVSAVSALLFIPMIPKAIAMPSLTRALDEIKELNAALEKQVEELCIKDNAIASSFSAILFADLDGKLTYANHAFLLLMGYRSEQEVVGTHAFNFCHLQEDAANIGDALLKRGNWVGELSAEKRDGTVFYVELVGNVVTGKSGKPICIMGSLIDITGRKQAEKKLQESEERYKSVVNNIPIGVSVISPDMKVISVNPQMNRWFPELDVTTHPSCFEAFNNPPGEGVCVYCPVCLTLKDGEAHEALTDTPSPEGTRHYRVISAPIRDAGGNVTAAIELVEDYTEQKKLEAQLRHSQKMEAVGQLAGGIAHDFNNMLNVIMGYSGILQMKMAADDPLRVNVDHVLTAAERAAGLTQSLLAFSRKQVIRLQPVNLREIILDVEKFLARIIGEDVEIHTIIKEDVLMVTADKGQIEQVLMNLATNARDAMPQGGTLSLVAESVEIDREYVKAHGYGEPGMYALIAVTDTGSGMDADTAGRIFEPFFTTKDVGKGTGLGLAIVYGIVKQHNGYLNVYSEPCKGTTFKIYLPLLETEHPEKEPLPVPSQQGGTETILVAEDDPAIRSLTKGILEESGYTVIAAVDGRDALEKFIENRDRIQLLLLDIIMPKKHGKEVYDEIRRGGSAVKVIFVSGYPEDFIKKSGRLEEDSELLLKPITPQKLLLKIREVLDK